MLPATTAGGRSPSARGLVALLVVAMLAAADAGRAQTSEIWVAPDGDDTASGTATAPFATLGRARAAVRALRQRGATEDVRVVLRGGVHRVREPLSLGPEDGGSPEHPVVWTAAPGETPIVSGGVSITDWRAQADGTWQASAAGMPPFRELFVNGRRATRARHPDAGFLRVAAVGADRRTSFSFRPGDVAATAIGCELVFLHDWSISRIEVAAVDTDGHVLRLAHPAGCAAPHFAMDNFEKHPRYFLEGARAFLDAAGEWHLDPTAGTVHYVPRPGETPETTTAVAPLAQGLLVVRGSPEQPVHALHFAGLTFAHCAFPLPGMGYAESQACFYEPRDGGKGRGPVAAAVHFEWAEGCIVRDCRLAHLGGSALWLGAGCIACRVENSHVHDVSGNGVMVGEDAARAVAGRPWWQAAPEQAASGNEVLGNLVEECGAQFFGAVGIWVGLANRTRIAHNEVRALPYTGVSVGWRWNPEPTPAAENIVELNHIHHVMQVLSDGAGIYTLGRQPGSRLARNLIHDVPTNAGRAESNGMFLDEGTTDFEITENVIHGVAKSPLRFHRATTNVVRSNIVAVAEGAAPIRYNNTTPADIRQDMNRVVAEEDPALVTASRRLLAAIRVGANARGPRRAGR